MTQEKIDKLAEIGFDISGESSKVRQDQRHRMKSKSDVKWEQNFNSLVEYKEKFGNCDVKNGENDEYKKLAGWVGVQRTKYKKKMNVPKHRTSKVAHNLDRSLLLYFAALRNSLNPCTSGYIIVVKRRGTREYR